MFAEIARRKTVEFGPNKVKSKVRFTLCDLSHNFITSKNLGVYTMCFNTQS
jgi:hypothetical protein